MEGNGIKKQHCLTLNSTLYEAARKKARERCGNNLSGYIENLIIKDLLNDNIKEGAK